MTFDRQSTINAILDAPSMEDLEAIQAAMKTRWDELVRRKQLSFVPGERVYFETRHGQRVTGTVERRLQKNVKVTADDGASWRVGPSLLRKVNP